jgi:ABC-type amino acid transport substrate-binding protein
MRKQGVAWMALLLALGAFALAVRQSLRQADFSYSAAVPQSTLTKVLREKRLRAAYIEYPPTAFRDPTTGQMRGHFVDTLNEIVRQLDPGIEVLYEETSWADFGAALNTRRVDLSIAGTFTTTPRAKVVAFTQPLVFLGRSAIVRKGDNRFRAQDGPMQFDRPDIKIGVVDGEGSHEFVRANFKNQHNIVVFSGSDLSQCLAAVSAGQVDVGMSDALETMKYAKVHSEVADLFAENPYDLTPIAWAVRQDDYEWKAFLDTAIETLDAQGKLAAFEHNYDYRWMQPVRAFAKR